MLLLQDARRQSGFIVAIKHGNRLLQDDGAVVEVFIHKMNGHAGNFGAVLQGLLLRLQPGKGGKKGRMDVENSVGEGAHEIR